MKRLLYILFLLFANSFLYSQFDTEHWIAPFSDKTSVQNPEQYLYLSTNKTTPFEVEIYNNNTLYKKVSISKGNPGIVPIDRDLIISSDLANLFIPNKMGLHLIADYKFFAHLRFSVMSHAEIITSKGKAGLGNEFYAYTPVNNYYAGNANSTVGIIASEDNTTITLDHFNDNTTLSNGDTVDQTTVKTISLNKGQSYILETSAFSERNLLGLNTLHIKSNKPIAVTNGNFNFIAPNKANNDIYMDQASPIERLGTEYISLKGNGNINTQMEVLAIIATEDNTSYYINGSATPNTLAKKGDYTIVASSNYVNLNSSVDAYNMYIKSDKKIYVYQMLAGVNAGTGANSYASGGMNILPQLACLLPNKIDEFANVSEIGNQSNFNVRLNVITEKGATVKINGTTASSINGPFPVQGTTDWETYVFPNVSGNISIESTKAVTAGISGGSGAVGFGGYFAGFNSNPIISKGGDCDKNNITLEVDDTYDSYQWYKNGVPYTGTDAKTYTIKPDGPGYYYVKIIKNNCGTQDSPIYKLLPCTVKSTQEFTIGSCNPVIKITPKFTKSTNAVDPASIKILYAPSNGITSVDSTTGEITYTFNGSAATTDSFVYTFSSTDPDFPDSETVTVNIIINHFKTITGEAFACIKPDKTGDFDLTKAKVSNDTNVTSVEYYENYDAATKIFSNLISNFSNYNSVPKTIYAKVTNSFGCTEVAEIKLQFYPIPNIDTLKFDSTLCDTDFDGQYEPDFDEISKTIVSNATDFDIYYFDNAGFNFPALPKNWTYTAPNRVYVLVASRNGCTNATGFIDFKIGNKATVSNFTSQICDGDFTNAETVNLASYLPQLTSETGYNYQFYSSQNNANLEQNPISDSQNISANATFFVRIKKAGVCDNIASLTLNFGQPSKSTTLPAAVTICEGDTTTLDAGTGFTSYLWNNGATTQTITVGKGDYSVVLTSNNTCSYTQKVSVIESPKAMVDISKYNTTICDDNLDGTVEVNLNNVTSAILLNPGIYGVKYYSNSTDANAGNTNILASNWSYTTDTTIFVRVESDYCPSQIYPLDFKIGNKVGLLATSVSQVVCDDNLNGIKTVNLKDFDSYFTADASVNIKYFNAESDAKNNVNSINNSLSITNSGTYFLRLEKANSCPNWAKLTVNVKIPKASSSLHDIQICKNATTLLNAGTDFDYYSWYSENNPSVPIAQGDALVASTINVPIGKYYVDLTSNGCIYRQWVNVTAAQDPNIDSIIVDGNTITINVSGGTPPYIYSIDGINYQSSNVFTSLKRGLQTAYVKGAELCDPVEKQFLVLNLINAITPNGDGKNDVLDYSDLRIKKDVKMLVFDRHGNHIFSSQNKNSFIWNGMSSANRPIPTDTYWYVLEWIEPDTNVKMTFKGWILVKNRN